MPMTGTRPRSQRTIETTRHTHPSTTAMQQPMATAQSSGVVTAKPERAGLVLKIDIPHQQARRSPRANSTRNAHVGKVCVAPRTRSVVGQTRSVTEPRGHGLGLRTVVRTTFGQLADFPLATTPLLDGQPDSRALTAHLSTVRSNRVPSPIWISPRGVPPEPLGSAFG